MSLLRAVAGVDRHFGGYRKDRPGRHLTLTDDGYGLPDECVLDDSAIPIFDQASFGTCVANGAAFLAAWLKWRAQKVVWIPSRWGIYNPTRRLEGTSLSDDTGLEPADAMAILGTAGVCEESLFPYLPENFDKDPPPEAVAAALEHKSQLALRCASINAVMRSIADGFPVGFGMRVHESFESGQVASSGIVPMPEAGEKQDGGHFQVVTGFKRSMVHPSAPHVQGYAKVRNSWSDGWGQGGYSWIPLAMWRAGLCDDNWTDRREDL